MTLIDFDGDTPSLPLTAPEPTEVLYCQCTDKPGWDVMVNPDYAVCSVCGKPSREVARLMGWKV